MIGVACYIVFSVLLGTFWTGYYYHRIELTGQSEWACARESVIFGGFCCLCWPLITIQTVIDYLRSGK